MPKFQLWKHRKTNFNSSYSILHFLQIGSFFFPILFLGRRRSTYLIMEISCRNIVQKIKSTEVATRLHSNRTPTEISKQDSVWNIFIFIPHVWLIEQVQAFQKITWRQYLEIFHQTSALNTNVQDPSTSLTHRQTTQNR